MIESSPRHVRTGAWNLVFQYTNVLYMILSGIVLVPLYLRYIGTDIYGAWLAMFALLQWILIVDPGISTVTSQMIARAMANRDQYRIYNVIIFSTVIHSILGVVALAFLTPAFDLLFNFLKLPLAVRSDLDQNYLIASAAVAISMMSYGGVSLCQGLQSSLGIGLILSVANFIGILTGMIFLFSDWGLYSITIPLLIRGTLIFVGSYAYLLIITHRLNIDMRQGLHWGYGVEIVKASGHNFLGTGSTLILRSLDTVLISRLLGNEAVIAYTLMKKSSDIARVLLQRISTALMPVLSNQVLNTDMMPLARRLHVIVMYGSFIFLFLNLNLNEQFMALWVGNDYFLGHAPNILLSSCAALGVINVTATNILISNGDFKYPNFVSLLGNLISLPTMYFGVIMGEVDGMLLAMLITTGIFPLIFLHWKLLKNFDFRYSVVQEALINIPVLIALTLLIQSWLPQWNGIFGFCLFVLGGTAIYIFFTSWHSVAASLLIDLLRQVFRSKPGTEP